MVPNTFSGSRHVICGWFLTVSMRLPWISETLYGVSNEKKIESSSRRSFRIDGRILERYWRCWRKKKRMEPVGLELGRALKECVGMKWIIEIGIIIRVFLAAAMACLPPVAFAPSMQSCEFHQVYDDDSKTNGLTQLVANWLLLCVSSSLFPRRMQIISGYASVINLQLACFAAFRSARLRIQLLLRAALFRRNQLALQQEQQ